MCEKTVSIFKNLSNDLSIYKSVNDKHTHTYMTYAHKIMTLYLIGIYPNICPNQQ